MPGKWHRSFACGDSSTRLGDKRALRILLALFELLDHPALLLIFDWLIGGFQAGRCVSNILFRDILACFGIPLFPLALLYIIPAVYAHCSPFLPRGFIKITWIFSVEPSQSLSSGEITARRSDHSACPW